ncbi:MAG TPA: glycosyltransferase family 4 protein [Lapillicoccus sp.]|nr:glycosyltransferase family 4 protein [Lapillicoccus sp.]
MTRIALLPSAYPPSVGGVEELSRQLALTLRDAGDEVEIWTSHLDHRDQASASEQDGVVVRRFPMPLPGLRPQSWPPVMSIGRRSLADLRRATETFRPDVLHVQCFGPNGVYATALSRSTRIPLVVSLQGETVMDDHDIFEQSHTMRFALRAGLRRASAVTACSRFTLDDATRFGLPPGAGEVVFNGVALDQPTGAVRVGDDQRYVLAIGRVVPKKGFDLLIEGFARIADRHPDVELRIGGAGSALADLTALAEAKGLGARVRFVGRQDRGDVAALMAGADCVVMPSRLEPFGIVVLEGWRAGAPVVATTHGGPPEFVDNGVTGLLVDPFDTDAVASALDRLLGDAALRKAIGAAGAEEVRRFAWPQITEQYRAIYRSVTPVTVSEG